MAYPLKVWNGTSWEQVSTASTDLTNYFVKQTSIASSGESSTANINTKPWNMPWGIQSNTNTINNTVTSLNIVGLTTSFTFVSGRRYKVSAMVVGVIPTSGRVLGKINVGTLGGNRVYDISGAMFFNLGGYCIVTGTGTSQSVTVTFEIVSGAANLSADSLTQNYHSLTIEDVGPA